MVNKADTAEAGTVSRQLRQLRTMAAPRSGLAVPILHTVATRAEGIDELVAAIDKHRDWLAGSGELARRRSARVGSEIEAIALAGVRRRFSAGAVDGLAARVQAGELDPYAAADELLAGLSDGA